MASSIFIGFLPGVPYSTSGSTVTFTGSVGATTSFLAGDGTAAAPSYSFTSDPGTGLYWIGNDRLGYAYGSGSVGLDLDGTTPRLVINSGWSLNWGSSGVSTPDVSLSRGAANLLQVASGDSVKLVLGVLYGGGVLSRLATVTTISTAGAVTYSAAEIAGGLILRDCNGGARADLVPTAANLLAAIPSAQVGQSFEFTIRNTSGTAVSITVTTNTGVTLSGTMVIAQNNSKKFMAVFTNVTAASEAYTLYSLGTSVF